jgi:hypothetical protein
MCKLRVRVVGRSASSVAIWASAKTDLPRLTFDRQSRLRAKNLGQAALTADMHLIIP